MSDNSEISYHMESESDSEIDEMEEVKRHIEELIPAPKEVKYMKNIGRFSSPFEKVKIKFEWEKYVPEEDRMKYILNFLDDEYLYHDYLGDDYIVMCRRSDTLECKVIKIEHTLNNTCLTFKIE